MHCRKPKTFLVPQERISDFFSEYVTGWLLGDLQHCARQEKNLSFTVACLALNAVDFFGGLYTGRGSSGNSFRQFAHRYMPGYETIDSEISLYNSYRCGLVHEYFPKRQHSVVWNRPHEHLVKANGRWSLNAQSLALDVETAITEYRADLRDDPKLHKNFSDRLITLLGFAGVMQFVDGDAGRSDTVQVFGHLVGRECVDDDTAP